MAWFQGKKTYILGVISILGAVAGFLTGTVDFGTAWIAVQAALASMAIRDGITTESLKK